MSSSRYKAGFSLIEVMVAVLILGISLVGLTRGITTALEASKESERQTTAALYASGKIETLQAESDLENGETSGDCGAALPAYQWKQTVADTDITGLHEVTVEIDNAHTGEMIFELKTMLFDTGDETAGGNALDKNGRPRQKRSSE